MTLFTSIQIQNWRQFASVSIQFHPRLTIITGSNGAGKSTILNICSQHFGYSPPVLATPRKKKGGGLSYDQGYYSPETDTSAYLYDDDAPGDIEGDHDDQLEFLAPYILEESPRMHVRPGSGDFIKIGTIDYSNGIEGTLGFAEGQSQAYGIQIQNQQDVRGVPIGSHRPASSYQPVQGLSLQLVTLTNAYQAYFSEYIARMSGGNTQFSPLYRMKETLIAMAAFGEGNQHLERNSELLSAFENFQRVLRRVLPREIGFQKLLVRVPDIVLKTRAGEFILDASSGGVSSVIEIAWQLHLYSLSNASFVVTLDEPENHLHPSMQRTILSNLIEAFPQAQFVVATHSPFIVSAVEDSRVYVLQYMGSVGQSGFPHRGPRRVRSLALDQMSKAGSASEILKEVLGVRVTIPEWAARRLEAVVSEFEGADVTPETLKKLRTKLTETGFSEYYPEALARLVGEND